MSERVRSFLPIFFQGDQNTEAHRTDHVELPEWASDLQKINYLPEKLIIAEPLSYCAGVVRANKAADEMLTAYQGQPVSFYHAPIHNETQLTKWENQGATVVNSLDEIPEGVPVLFSAHGVYPEIWFEAKKKHLKVVDATCPLVEKTHREVRQLRDEGYTILLVGHKNHDEIVGTFGEAPDNIVVVHPRMTKEELDIVFEGLKDTEKVALRSQTTLALADLLEMVEYIKSKRPDINLPKKSDICYATENRQKAVVEVIGKAGADLMIIFGSDETKRTPSSNSMRLRDVAQDMGVKAYLVEDVWEIQAEWFSGARRIGISAGASAAPERVMEFLLVMMTIGLQNNQIEKIVVTEESQVFAPAKTFDFSNG